MLLLKIAKVTNTFALLSCDWRDDQIRILQGASNILMGHPLLQNICFIFNITPKFSIQSQSSLKLHTKFIRLKNRTSVHSKRFHNIQRAMNNKKQILCVEDDAAILMPLRYALEREEWQVTWANTGTQAITFVQQQTFDFIILDVGLPDINGFDVCKKIRQFNHTPLLFLTARDDEIDRIVGLEIGADDYCTKPFSSREIVSRIKAIWRRMDIQSQLQAAQSTIEIQAIIAKTWQCIDESLQIHYQGSALQLTRYEYRLLKLLIDHPEQVFSRQQLMDHIWEHPEHSLERTVDTHIKSLRQKLKHISAEHDPITTHRGFGYSLKRM